MHQKSREKKKSFFKFGLWHCIYHFLMVLPLMLRNTETNSCIHALTDTTETRVNWSGAIAVQIVLLFDWIHAFEFMRTGWERERERYVNRADDFRLHVYMIKIYRLDSHDYLIKARMQNMTHYHYNSSNTLLFVAHDWSLNILFIEFDMAKGAKC